MKNNIKAIPDIMISRIKMKEPNESINIHEGDFELKYKDKTIKLNGYVKYDWLPDPGVRFKGKTKTHSLEIVELLQHRFELIIDGLKLGDCFITNTSSSKVSILEGIFYSRIVKGDKSIPLTRIEFVIPNLRAFSGTTVKIKFENDNYRFGKNRISFENDEYQINIDKSFDYEELNKSLKDKGGYIVLYCGEIIKKDGHILFDGLTETLNAFSTYLSFLNGRRCSPLFIHGIHEGAVKWVDYTNYVVDQYKAAESWPPRHSIDNLDDLWKNFSQMWKIDDDKDFLKTVIHWYIEANLNSGYLEGSIVMSQIALELIYNWLVIEKRRILVGKDSEDISASNKIRLLLSQLKVDCDVPDSLNNLKTFVDGDIEIVDGVDAFVQVRNAIIHSQDRKRKKLKTINHSVKSELRKLGLWYIELSILYALQYKGKYYNRCSYAEWAGEGEMTVPWHIEKN